MSNLTKRKWTDEELLYAFKNINLIPIEELGEKIDRSPDSITKKLQTTIRKNEVPSYYRFYTKEEDDKILNLYGTMTLEDLAVSMFRSKSSVYSRLFRLTGDNKFNTVSGNLSTQEVSLLLGYTVHYVRKIIKKHETPFERFGGLWMCDYDEFWKWIKDNPQFVNAKNIDFDDLYHAPDWYLKLVNDKKRELVNSIKKGEYTTKEIALVKYLKLQGKSFKDIAEELNRTPRSVRLMFNRLKTNENLYLIN